jgi:hypothetical protein
LKLNVILLGLALYLMPVSQANAEACLLNGDSEITNTITTVESSWCTVTPDYASFPLYKLGLCSTIPTYDNYQTVCSFFVDNAVAQDLEISKGSNLNIADEISLADGSYPAAVILLGNEISLRHTAAFYDDQDGWEIGVGLAAGNRCATSTSSGSQDDIDERSVAFSIVFPKQSKMSLPLVGLRKQRALTSLKETLAQSQTVQSWRRVLI